MLYNPYIRTNCRDSYGNLHFNVTADNGDRCIDFEVSAVDENEAYDVAVEIAAVDYGFYAPDTCIDLELIEPDWLNEL